MSDIDRHYRVTYTLPPCPTCGRYSLEYDTYMVYKVKLFCGAEDCPSFVKTFWVDKKDLEKK